MTYEEKCALLDDLKREAKAKPHVVGTWELACSTLDRAEVEPKAAPKRNEPKPHLPLEIPEEEAKRLFPRSDFYRHRKSQMTFEQRLMVLHALEQGRIGCKQISEDLGVAYEQVRQLRRKMNKPGIAAAVLRSQIVGGVS